MSEFYSVQVASREGRNVRLSVRIINPDAADIFVNKSFALLMMIEGAKGDVPLTRAVSFSNACDSGWAAKYASGFIEKVRLTSVEYPVPDEAMGNPGHRYWRNATKRMKGVLDITTSDPAWCEHLKVGQRFESASYEITRTFERCAPIHPGKVPSGAGAIDPDTGFVWVPKLCLLRPFTQRMVPDRLPELLRAPAYDGAAYKVVETLKGKDLTPDALRKWLGQAVQWKDDKRVRTGVLIKVKPDYFHVAHFDADRAGIGGGRIRDTKWIGRIAFQGDAKRGAPVIQQSSVVGLLPTFVVRGKVTGRTLKLTLFVGPGEGIKALRSESDVLNLLLMPEYDSMALPSEVVGLSPLASAIRQEIQLADEGNLEVLPVVAKGYISKFRIEQARAPSLPDLDDMTGQEAKEFLANYPWRTATVSIEATDPSWISHLQSFDPFPIPEASLPAPRRWKGPPRRWKKPSLTLLGTAV